MDPQAEARVQDDVIVARVHEDVIVNEDHEVSTPPSPTTAAAEFAMDECAAYDGPRMPMNECVAYRPARDESSPTTGGEDEYYESII